jgi:2,4-dienoyl-CoA reductase-like NADH-dependent reductase (Old Yellow Enzyme family)
MIEPRVDVFVDGYKQQQETLEPFRKMWRGPFLSVGGYTYDRQAALDVAERTGGLVGFGRLFISNPDLVERLREGWPTQAYDRSTFYTPGPKGYVDYPFYKA